MDDLAVARGRAAADMGLGLDHNDLVARQRCLAADGEAHDSRAYHEHSHGQPLRKAPSTGAHRAH